jgi:hypothetical protein
VREEEGEEGRRRRRRERKGGGGGGRGKEGRHMVSSYLSISTTRRGVLFLNTVSIPS